MRYRFYMDGVQVSEPGISDDKIQIEITRDEQQRVISERVDGTFTWGAINRQTSTPDGYSILYAKFRESFCNRIELQIDQKMTPNHQWETLFTGFIYVTDCTFDREKNTAECQITDNSFYSRIDSNRNLKFNIDTGFTKNGITTPAVTSIPIDFFDPDNAFATYSILDVDCYRVTDVLAFLVRCISDNQMTGSSPIFNTGGDFENIVICTGSSIRDAAGGSGAVSTPPYLSFDDIWETVFKQFNLWMRISGTTIVIEKNSDQYAAGTILTMTNVKNITEQCELDRLYSKVSFGSSAHQESLSGVFAWPETRFFTHAEEEYHNTGDCNHVDEELDLKTTFITSSNVIQDVIDNDNDAHDEDIFLVEATTTRARKYDYFSGPPFVYNALLTNSEVAIRWQDSITNSIAYYKGSGDDNFRARLTAASADWGVQTTPYTNVPIDYDTILNDPNANYNAAGDYYDVPNGGVYSFRVIQDVDDIAQTDFGGFPFRFSIIFERLNSSGLFISEETFTEQLSGPELSHSFEASVTMALSTGDRVRVEYAATANGPGPGEVSFDIKIGTFETTAIVNGGGIFADGLLVNVITWKFNRKLSYAEFNDLHNHPQQRISVNGTDTWIRSMKWDSYRQMADFVLLENL